MQLYESAQKGNKNRNPRFRKCYSRDKGENMQHPATKHHEVIDTLYESPATLVLRAADQDTGDAIIMKILREEYPEPGRLFRFRQEYEILSTMDSPYVIRAKRIEKYHHSLAIILEDIEGVSLKRVLEKESISISRCLDYAALAANGLAAIHANGIIHKDVNPSNIIVNPKTGTLKYIDFGISEHTRELASRKKEARDQITGIEGTISYISPEQTGRMGRGTDTRTDLYSLGATLYELFTSAPPFETPDPAELIHCHLARIPAPARQRRVDIPVSVEKILHKLLEKEPKDRYQSAIGVYRDFETLQNWFRSKGEIPDIPLGTQDRSFMFTVSGRLRGRDNELGMLENAILRKPVEVFLPDGKKEAETRRNFYENNGHGVCILVSGAPGIGKTALIREAGKRAIEEGGTSRCLVFGKYDSLRKNIPYSAWIEAMTELIRRLYTEPEMRLLAIRKRIRAGLGSMGRVITEVIPELEGLIGEQPRVPELSPGEAGKRFHLAFANMIDAVSDEQFSPIFFLDDLQWADLGSLTLIKEVLTKTENPYLTLILAFRDNEVGMGHPFSLVMHETESAGIRPVRISLFPVKEKGIQEFISDCLGSPEKSVDELSGLVYEKTGGNPFFMKEFLTSLHEEELIRFDFSRNEWTWDIGEIRTKAITDNVADLLMARMQKLPEEMQTVLMQAAAYGSRIRTQDISMITGLPKERIRRDLKEMKALGLILENPGYDRSQTTFRFCHDRIRQAAYTLIPEKDRPKVHFAAGKLLLARLDEDETEKRLFDIVNHLNNSIPKESRDFSVQKPSPDVFPDEGEKSSLYPEIKITRITLAQLNLRAGKKAKEAAAYGPAYYYLTTGIFCLVEKDWKNHYSLCLEIFTQACETAYLSGKFSEMELYAQIIMKKARDFMDKVQVFEIRIQSKIAENRIIEAISIALTALDILGIHLPESPGKARVVAGYLHTRSLLTGKKVEDLADLPVLTDTRIRAGTRILFCVITAAYLARPELWAMIVLHLVNFSLRYGNSQASPVAYTYFGVFLCGVAGNVNLGYRFCELGKSLSARFDNEKNRIMIDLSINSFVRYWREPLSVTRNALLTAYRELLETGDQEYACWALHFHSYHSFFSGQELAGLEKEMRDFAGIMRRYNQHPILFSQENYRQTVINLLGKNDDALLFTGEAYDEETMLMHHVEQNDQHGLFNHFFHKLILAYLFHDYENADNYAQKAKKHLDSVVGLFVVPVFYMLDALVCFAIYRDTGFFKRLLLRFRIWKNRFFLRRWVKQSPENHRFKEVILKAESARIFGKDEKALQNYDLAIRIALENGVMYEEAMAREQMAAMFHEKGLFDISGHCMRGAFHVWKQWGAEAKAAHLLEKYPGFLRISAMQEGKKVSGTTTTTRTEGMDFLDLETVIRATRTVSQEIHLEKLIERLMNIAIINAGAQRGVLILQKEKGFYISARFDEEGKTIVMQDPLSVGKGEENPFFSPAVFQYTVRKEEPVVLMDAGKQGEFVNDRYIRENKVKSVLCLPLVNQGKLVGALYLENNLAADAFTRERVELLEYLSAQMAISLENAGLYLELQLAHAELSRINRTLEEKVKDRTKELFQKNEKLVRAIEKVEEANRKITESITYANRIQSSILPAQPEISAAFSRFFLIWMPRDIVGGDFYDIRILDDGFIAIVADCTGHGVPGAFMTMIASTGLKTIIQGENVLSPSGILSRLNSFVRTALRQNTEDGLSDDGLDAAVLRVVFRDDQNGVPKLYYAGARTPLLYLEDNQINEIRGNRHSLGYKRSDPDYVFDEHEMSVQKGMRFYLTTDGYTDQKGGEKGFSFSTSRFRRILEETQEMGFADQKSRLIQEFIEYMGDYDRLDDVTVFGFDPFSFLKK